MFEREVQLELTPTDNQPAVDVAKVVGHIKTYKLEQYREGSSKQQFYKRIRGFELYSFRIYFRSQFKSHPFGCDSTARTKTKIIRKTTNHVSAMKQRCRDR